MHFIFKLSFAVITLIFILSHTAMAQKQMKEPRPGHQEMERHEANGTALKLSPELMGLLTQEMQSIQAGMIDIFVAITAGDWDRVAKTADQIAKSFIMKKQLSPEQFKKLASSLPMEFRTIDNEFHRKASMLSHVAKERHVDLVHFYYYKMTEYCVTCHSTYATNKFPKFKPGTMDHGKHDDHHQP